MKTHKVNRVRPFSAFIDACVKEPYSFARLLKDIIAGITVGIIAIPLAMALAIGSGVPRNTVFIPQLLPVLLSL